MPSSYIHSDNEIIKKLEIKANELRMDVVKMLWDAGSGHSAGSLGTADIFSALYFHILNVDPKNPDDPNRDRFLLSNGHICPVWYAALAHKGFFPKKDLLTLRELGSMLTGHPTNKIPGVENTSGSLGQGFSQAIGKALAAKHDHRSHRIYVMTGDGELNEGQVWEAALFAPGNKLNNITWIIDRNNIQSEGHTEEVLPLENLREKLEAFNWYVIEIDGHNIEEIINSCNMAKTVTSRPTAVIAHTIPGKGVEFMEYKVDWHAKSPNKAQAKKALAELRSLKGKIRYDHD